LSRRPIVLAVVLGLSIVSIALSGPATAQQQSAEVEAAGAHPQPADGAGHGNHVVPVLAGLVVILVGAKLGGELAERIGQPSVLGELVAGVILGNLALVGFDRLELIGSNEGIAILAELGVILLLFEVGLESSVREMLSVGPSSLLVALLGVAAPMLLGWGVSAWAFPDHHPLVHVFVGATLCATSVGITARVLADLGKLAARESKIILGAAVIDDVLGLVILAVVSGVIAAANTGGTLELMQFLGILGKAIAFLGGAVLVGGWVSPRLFAAAFRLRIRGVLLAFALAFCMLLAWLAERFGLEPIVGAFAAGMILEKAHYKSFVERGEHEIEELLHPITAFLVPVFFVVTGMQVDLTALGRFEVLGFALLLSVLAIIGKMLCWFGVLERGLDRLSVAVGMVPRGEVGLIFAGIGAALVLNGQPVIDISLFSALVIMVMITTFVTPPALKWTLARGDRAKASRAP
jgi:Kef-type K+ transport system membrane component KefB